jgi:hypothetical protein
MFVLAPISFHRTDPEILSTTKNKKRIGLLKL